MPAATLIDPATGAFRPAADIRARFDAVGAFDKQRVITYCGGGIAASTDALALVMLGHPDVQALRCLDVGMVERPQPADGTGE